MSGFLSSGGMQGLGSSGQGVSPLLSLLISRGGSGTSGLGSSLTGGMGGTSSGFSPLSGLIAASMRGGGSNPTTPTQSTPIQNLSSGTSGASGLGSGLGGLAQTANVLNSIRGTGNQAAPNTAGLTTTPAPTGTQVWNTANPIGTSSLNSQTANPMMSGLSGLGQSNPNILSQLLSALGLG